MGDLERLWHLLRARYPCIFIPTFEEAEAMSMLREASLKLSGEMRVWTYSRGVHEGLLENDRGVKDTEPPAAGLYYLLHNPRPGIVVLVDIIDHLSDPRVLRLLRDLIDVQRGQRGHVVLVDSRDGLPDVIGREAARFEMSLPDEKDLVDLIRQAVKRENEEQKVQAKVSGPALKAMVRNLRGLSRRQAERIIVHVVTEDRKLDDSDLSRIVARKRQLLHKDGLLDYVESLATLEEIAGLAKLKQWLRQRERCFDDAATGRGLHPPRGILMLGVPGAGKSLCAKAVAAAWHRPLLRLDPSVLYDRYIGESERKLRDALRQAEAMSPIVLWIDEIEKGLASAASQSNDGGLSRRMFGTMLTWMQEHTAPVFVIATANDIQALPAELLRKGRFDEIFFIDLPSPENRKAIFRIHLSKRGLSPDRIDVEALARVSDGFTGAEIEQAIVSALYDSLGSGGELTTQAIISSLSTSPPLSITMGEHIAALRDWAAGRCVPAD